MIASIFFVYLEGRITLTEKGKEDGTNRLQTQQVTQIHVTVLFLYVQAACVLSGRKKKIKPGKFFLITVLEIHLTSYICLHGLGGKKGNN